MGLFLATASNARQEFIRIRCKIPINKPLSLAMSSAGQYFGTVETNGTIHLYNNQGKLLWERQVEGVTDILIAKDGQMILAFSKLNPEQKCVYFFRNDGRLLWRHYIGESVLSGAISPDGFRAAITTDERHIYVYKPISTRPTYRRWLLDGNGYDIAFTPDSERLVLATSQEPSLVCYDVNGRFQWRYEHESDDKYDLCTSTDGKYILGVVSGTQHEPGIKLHLWDTGGKKLWTKKLDDFDARALISPKSRYVAVSYASFVGSPNSGMIERKLMVYQTTGRVLWEKGGLFFGPQLVAISPTGSSIIVSDGERSLYEIDKRGKITSKFTFRATVRKTLSCENGQRVLLYCGDGWLYLIHLS